MDRLLNALKAHSAGLDAAFAQPRFGLVSSVDPATATARVLFQPEGVLSGWLPVLTSWGGNGWGLACPPTPGQQVLVVAQEGAAEHGVIMGVAYSQTNPPPAAPSGELWLVHASGSFLKLRSDGSIVASASQILLTGTVSVTGNASISGNLSVAGSITDATGSVGVTANP